MVGKWRCSYHCTGQQLATRFQDIANYWPKKADDLLQKHYTDYSRTQVSVQPRRPQLKVAYTRLPNTERRVPELIPVLGSQPAGDVSHKHGGRLPLLSAMPTVALATLKRAATNFAAW